jgi:hypothetical protein
MTIPRHYYILGCTLALMAIVGFLSAISRTRLDLLQNKMQKNDPGSAQAAFDVACRTIEETISAVESDPVSIDPQYRATLQSQSRIWTIKGYASCPRNINKSYRWTVILTRDHAQEWEILVKVFTPEFTTPYLGQTDGISQVQGKQFQDQ